MNTTLDFRSDTFTKPSAGMRKAMADAEVGDDVFREDPSLIKLEAETAELFGREAALFVPSGTMANLIGIALHCGRGDEVVMEKRTHSFSYETGGLSALLGVVASTVHCDTGILELDALETAIRGGDVHWPNTKLAIVENTANLAGGVVVSLEHMKALKALCDSRGLALHMDGARIWNAAAASGTRLDEFAASVSTLSCCLSKGLGCPVGSLIVGDRDQIEKARWQRKMLGGGMRQAGVLAAAGLYALKHHLPRIGEDHAMAQRVAAALRHVYGDRVTVEEPASNMVRLHTNSAEETPRLVEEWKAKDILAFQLGPNMIRLVTHMDLPERADKMLVEALGQ